MCLRTPVLHQTQEVLSVNTCKLSIMLLSTQIMKDNKVRQELGIAQWTSIRNCACDHKLKTPETWQWQYNDLLFFGTVEGFTECFSQSDLIFEKLLLFSYGPTTKHIGLLCDVIHLPAPRLFI